MASRLALSLAILGILAGTMWAVVTVEAVVGQPGAVELATALMFTTMLVVLPFLMGWRRAQSQWVHEAPCRECGFMAFPVAAFGFCIRCGAQPRKLPQPL